MRVGIGYDIHRLVDDRKLILGGIHIPHDRGLKGHSDGDALLHAIADAMLGAAALGDIGQHFPDTDPEYEGADSAGLLGEVAHMISEQGLEPENVDANVIAQEPKLAPHIMKMRRRIAEILKMPMEGISVKARTKEKLGAVGEGEAIEVHAAVMLKRREETE